MLNVRATQIHVHRPILAVRVALTRVGACAVACAFTALACGGTGFHAPPMASIDGTDVGSDGSIGSGPIVLWSFPDASSDARNEASPPIVETEGGADAAGDAAAEAGGCMSDPQCSPPTPYCSAGTCQALKPLGHACSAGTECTSGNCIDGVCCGLIACGECQVCGTMGACVARPSGSPCSTLPPHTASAACDGQGFCAGTSCATFYYDCDNNPLNGCETPQSLSNCLGCGDACQPQNVFGPYCSGNCGYGVCAPFDNNGNTYLDCDRNQANGCETSPNDPANCGACGNDCTLTNKDCMLTSTGYRCLG